MSFYGPLAPGTYLSMSGIESTDDADVLFYGAPDDQLGKYLQAGDFNGDGFEDLVIGRGTGNGPYIVYGKGK